MLESSGAKARAKRLLGVYLSLKAGIFTSVIKDVEK
jgi:hypothetical protein